MPNKTRLVNSNGDGTNGSNGSHGMNINSGDGSGQIPKLKATTNGSGDGQDNKAPSGGQEFGSSDQSPIRQTGGV